MTRRMYCHESRKWVIYQKCSPTTLLLQVFTTHNFAQTTQYDGADHAPRCCSPRWSSSPHSRQRANAMRKRDCRLPRPKKVWLSLTPELTGPLFHWSAGYARGDHRRRPSTSAKSFTEVLNGLVRGSTNIRTMCAERGCRRTCDLRSARKAMSEQRCARLGARYVVFPMCSDSGKKLGFAQRKDGKRVNQNAQNRHAHSSQGRAYLLMVCRQLSRIARGVRTSEHSRMLSSNGCTTSLCQLTTDQPTFGLFARSHSRVTGHTTKPGTGRTRATY